MLFLPFIAFSQGLKESQMPFYLNSDTLINVIAPDGTKQELADFLLMASIEGTIQVTFFLYVNANERLAVALNANTDKNTLDNRLAVGANPSETARKIFKFFGSSFNTIAETAIYQCMAFFGALPQQYLAKIIYYRSKF